MESVRWDEIEVFVRSEVGLRKLIPLSVATRLWEDLGQTGDEADDLMGRFFERFSVDAGDFDFHRYFLMEGEGGALFVAPRMGAPKAARSRTGTDHACDAAPRSG
nr:DUF1493 family protein [Burkholderia sp. Ac-20345]